MPTIEPSPAARDLHMAIVVSRFNHPISLRLLDACLARLERAGVPDPDVMWVPGAFEIPLAARLAAASGRYRAIITLGVVIRGGTPHFEYVCRGVSDGVMRVALDSGLPVAFGVLTTDTVDQALERAAAAGESGSNKGAEAAEVALEMAGLCVALRSRT